MKQVIYLIRHGQSQSQSGETFEYLNPDLSQRGIAQARRLEPLLRRCNPDLICLSTMQRAWKTWQHAAVSAPKVRFDSRLVECYSAEHYLPALPIAVPAIAEPDRHNAYDWDVPARYNAWWAEVRQSRYRRVMAFCHWNTKAHIMRAIMGLGAENMVSYARSDNASLSVFEVDDDGTPCLLHWNYTEHLKGLLDDSEPLDFLR